MIYIANTKEGKQPPPNPSKLYFTYFRRGIYFTNLIFLFLNDLNGCPSPFIFSSSFY